ncbi:hypothetical protein P0L94_12835 [Microbacter sp. GSS18]|nr:hypothetical protein P0L94_12835 [Microbacter sp. GSS18]
MSETTITPADERVLDAEDVRELLEEYQRRGWTDGLPVVPVTASILDEFLATTGRHPQDPLFTIPHLNRTLTVRLAAVNAAMAGCLPEYFPVVLALWDAIAQEPSPARGIWQSTTGTAPFAVVNGPVRAAIGLNSAGNVFGSGHRANATIGRAVRLACINVFGLRPHALDQATQGTPVKYAGCIAENEEASPWPALHTEYGLDAGTSCVTAFVVRSVIHIEARHSQTPEQLALDFADTIRRTGALIHEYTSALLVVSPEHARLFADAGWSRDDLREHVYAHAVRHRSELAAVGKDAVSTHTHWRVPAVHPDATPDASAGGVDPERVRVLTSPHAVQIVVAGAPNAGVSAVVEIFGLAPRMRPSSFSPVEES